MLRHAVVSTSVAGVGYDATSRTLELEFRSGAVYHYLDVPYTVAQALCRSSSVGAYFSRHIRNVYDYQRVE